MTKEELEKATGQELIEQRDYCGVDGYYGEYLEDVNAEMLKRFNRLAELEKKNAELKEQIETMKCCEMCKHKNLNWEFSPICEARDKITIENPLTCKCDKWSMRND